MGLSEEASYACTMDAVMITAYDVSLPGDNFKRFRRRVCSDDQGKL